MQLEAFISNHAESKIYMHIHLPPIYKINVMQACVMGLESYVILTFIFLNFLNKYISNLVCYGINLGMFECQL